MLARLTAQGQLDPTFNPGAGPSAWVNVLALDQQERVIIGGVFEFVDRVSRRFLARFTPEGRLDESFDTSLNNLIVTTALITREQKIVAGGGGFTVDPIAARRILRFNNDGTYDSSFDVGAGLNGTPNAMVEQPDGKIIVGGMFTSFNGVNRTNLVRLEPDGAVDLTFEAKLAMPSNYWVLAITLLPDGKILVGATSTTQQPLARYHLVRLHSDGSLDTSFDPGSGPNDGVTSITVQPDSRIIIGGNFSSVDGVPRNRIARLYGNPHLELGRVSPDLQTITYPAVFSNWVLQASVELSATNWLNLTNLSSTVVGHDLVVTNRTAAEKHFYRLVKP